MFRTDEFQLSIVVDGNEQRVSANNFVHIPFNTEYAVRVRNNTANRIKFFLRIDGLASSEQYIANPFQTVTIERFLNGDLESGRKFKFVSINDPNVQNPSSSENGQVVVEIMPEKQLQITTLGQKRRIPSYRYYQTTNTLPYDTICCNSTMLFAGANNNVGATVEGSFSNQQFEYVDDFVGTGINTILSVTLRAIPEKVKLNSMQISPERFCANCGNKYRLESGVNFCTYCGTKLLKR